MFHRHGSLTFVALAGALALLACSGSSDNAEPLAPEPDAGSDGAGGSGGNTAPTCEGGEVRFKDACGACMEAQCCGDLQACDGDTCAACFTAPGLPIATCQADPEAYAIMSCFYDQCSDSCADGANWICGIFELKWEDCADCLRQSCCDEYLACDSSACIACVDADEPAASCASDPQFQAVSACKKGKCERECGLCEDLTCGPDGSPCCELGKGCQTADSSCVCTESGWQCASVGPGTCPSPGNISAACYGCLQARCVSDCSACMNNPACVVLADCLAACGGVCINDCSRQFPDGKADYEALFEPPYGCMLTQCANVCD